MKALIRKEGETVTEQDGIEGIDWATGAPLTNEKWCGGPYTLVQNYTAPTENSEATYTVVTEPQTETETITIDGQEYSLDAVRAALHKTE